MIRDTTRPSSVEMSPSTDERSLDLPSRKGSPSGHCREEEEEEVEQRATPMPSSPTLPSGPRTPSGSPPAKRARQGDEEECLVLDYEYESEEY